MSKSSVRRNWVSILILASAITSCGPTNYFVPEVKVNSGLNLVPVGAKTIRPPSTSSYYSFFHSATQLTFVRHFAIQSQNDNARELLYLEYRLDQLNRTVKTDQLSLSPYGIVTAQKTCTYGGQMVANLSSLQVLVESLSNSNVFELPEIVAEEPGSLPQVSSISVVRFLQDPSKVAFAVGNYESNGALGSIQSGASFNGELQPGSMITVNIASDFETIRKTSGLPSEIDVANYLRTNRITLPATTVPVAQTLVVIIYGFGALVREDSITNGIKSASRYMMPITTSEEKILNPICDSRFRQQQSSGLATVD